MEQVEFWQGFSEAHIADDCPSTSIFNCEASTMGDETMTKVRKPYTITKQRERWTEEEHQKFMDALKLHGRAWRRIEEHVGTKTAIQIRSHAQKFFSKLEREASSGLSTGISEIHIPPPRPKRKPSHPYPRKANVLFSSISSTVREVYTSSLSPPSAPSVIAVGSSSVDFCLKARPTQVVREGQLSQPNSGDFERSRECGRHVVGMQSGWDVTQICKIDALDSTTGDAVPSTSCKTSHKRGSEAVQHDDCSMNVKVESPKKVLMTNSDVPGSRIEGAMPVHQLEGETTEEENIPLEMYGQKLLTAVHELVSPFHPPHNTALSQNAPLDHSIEENTNLNSQSPTQPVSLNGIYASSSIVAHAGWGRSFTPWHLMHAARYDDPTAVWPGLAFGAPLLHVPLRPPFNFEAPNVPVSTNGAGAPLHVPLRPSFNFEAPNIPVSTNDAAAVAAAAAAAAAAASFAAASTWWALNGAIAHALTVPEMRARVNPAIYPDAIPGLPLGSIHLSQPSSGEQADRTVNAPQKADIHLSPPKLQDNTIIEECSRPSFDHTEGNHVKTRKEVRDQKKPSNNKAIDGIGHSGSTGMEKQCLSDGGNLLCEEIESELENGEGATFCFSGTSKNPNKTCVVQDGQKLTLPRENPSCNSPECGSSPLRMATAQSALERWGEDCLLEKYESRSVLKNLRRAFPASVICNVSQGSPVSAFEAQDNALINQGTEDDPEVFCGGEGKISMASEHIPSHARREVHDEALSLPSGQTECISGCGSRLNKKCPADSKLSSLQRVDTDAHSKIWEWDRRICAVPATLGEVGTFQSTCIGNKQDLERVDARASSLNVNLVNENKHQIHNFKALGIFASAASTSGTIRYSGVGFVPYRRSSTDAGSMSNLKLCIEEKQSSDSDHQFGART